MGASECWLLALSFDPAAFLHKLINDPVAVGTALLAIATFISARVAVEVPKEIELRREADLKAERERQEANAAAERSRAEAKAESERHAQLRMVAAILSALSIRVLSLLQAVRPGGIQSNQQFTSGVNEMLSALFTPDACAAIGDPMLAARLYTIATLTAQTLSSTEWIYQQGRTNNYLTVAETNLRGLSDKLLGVAREVSFDGIAEAPKAAQSA